MVKAAGKNKQETTQFWGQYCRRKKSQSLHRIVDEGLVGELARSPIQRKPPRQVPRGPVGPVHGNLQPILRSRFPRPSHRQAVACSARARLPAAQPMSPRPSFPRQSVRHCRCRALSGISGAGPPANDSETCPGPAPASARLSVRPPPVRQTLKNEGKKKSPIPSRCPPPQCRARVLPVLLPPHRPFGKGLRWRDFPDGMRGPSVPVDGRVGGRDGSEERRIGRAFPACGDGDGSCAWLDGLRDRLTASTLDHGKNRIE